jgi:mono/diheme cytochrome c family protein
MVCRAPHLRNIGFEVEPNHIFKGEFVKPSLFLFGPLLLLLLVVGTTPEAAETDAGKELYMQYCSSCHGEDGRGNGPVSTS